MAELIRIALLLAAVNTTSPTTDTCCAAAPPATAAPAFAAAGPPVPLVAATRPDDQWFGSDKVPHFWMSWATTAFTFGAVSAVGGKTDAALVAGVGAGAVAGIGKEIHDWRRGWTFSLKDLTVDALGVAAAYFFLREVR